LTKSTKIITTVAVLLAIFIAYLIVTKNEEVKTETFIVDSLVVNDTLAVIVKDSTKVDTTKVDTVLVVKK